ncbi:MAG: ATP-binding protein [Pseudomonadota bacterium]
MATLAYPLECTLRLPDGWINAQRFERALVACGDALGGPFSTVVVRISAGCSLMIDVVIRLLSFCNQVIASAKRLRLEFLGGADGVMGYLDRMGFFDGLNREAEVAPHRPLFSGAALHRGGNRGLVEIYRFSGDVRPDQSLPGELAKAVERACSSRHDGSQAARAIANIISELMSNVAEHSGSSLDAFAVLQTYTNGNRVTVAVSDSGKGIMGTLVPVLRSRGDPLANLTETDLLIEIFRKGLSSNADDNRGMGLMDSARSAIRYRADLDVRLLNQRVLLKPSGNAYRANTAYTQEKLPLLWGTHISFSLDLS